MVSKSASPWKSSHIEHVMKERLRDSDVGKEWLDRYGGRMPRLSPKLVHCLENHYFCQVNGVYQSFPEDTLLREYVRFYADGIVIASVSSGSPSEIAGWFKKENALIAPGEYRVDMAENGSHLWNISFDMTVPQGTIGYNGYMKANGVLCLSCRRVEFNGSRANRPPIEREYNFVPW